MVALDLQASGWLPLGFEVAQLVEDTALLDAIPDDDQLRTELAEIYLTELTSMWPQLSGIPEVGSQTGQRRTPASPRAGRSSCCAGRLGRYDLIPPAAPGPSLGSR